jgi:cell division protein FtsI/penicillin-binding protein 2
VRFRFTIALGLALPFFAATIHDDSVARFLDRRFPSSNISYLLVNVRERGVTASRWYDADRPIPVGSLVKPFTALAFAEAHPGGFPEFTCRGAIDRCWLARGHGRLNITGAIAQSCNAYFLNLAARVPPEAMRDVVARFGLTMPPVQSADAYIGEHGLWRLSPDALVQAYAELASRADDPTVSIILAGMAECARHGTASALGAGVLAKTGTAPCTHEPRATGDGFVLALYPASSPQFALLLREHGAPGADAARIAAQFLDALRTGF